MSHELKTPLSIMQVYAEELKLNIVKNKGKSNFYCDVIIDESIKMNKLVESLLNIDQMEFGDKTLHKSSFEINAFITQILNIYVKIFQDENIDFEVNTVAPTYVDENLTLKISLFKLKEHIRIEVFNSCNAIDTNDLEQIWDPFYKLDKARTREKGGHGLGLSIVKSIQEAHENSFGVKNIDNGVYFWFEIDIK